MSEEFYVYLINRETSWDPPGVRSEDNKKDSPTKKHKKRVIHKFFILYKNYKHFYILKAILSLSIVAPKNFVKKLSKRYQVLFNCL